MELVKYDAMCKAINACERVDEAKEISDKAAALQVYFRLSKNFQAENKAAKVRIRADRKWRKLYNEQEKNKGGGDKRSKNHRVKNKPSDIKTLKQLGINKTQADEAKKLADIPDDEFEQALSEMTNDVTRPCARKVIAKCNKSKSKPETVEPQISDDALFLWGRIKDFERTEILKFDVIKLFSEMTKPMQRDIVKLAPTIKKFFATVEKLTK
jgi:hypothetical protein